MNATRRSLLVAKAAAAAPASPFGGHATLTTSLQEFWNWDESSGTTAYGATGGHNLVTYGPHQENLSWISGLQGNCARGDNAVAGSEYFGWQKTSAACGRFTSSFSFTTWFKIHGDMWAEHFPIAEYASGSSAGLKWRVYFNNTTDVLYFQVSTDGTSYGTSVTRSLTPTLNQWYFVAATFDDTGNTIKLSVDDGTKGSTAFSGTLYDTLATFNVASDQDFYGNFSIDMTGLWTKALSDTEITDLYASGAGLPY